MIVEPRPGIRSKGPSSRTRFGLQEEDRCFSSQKLVETPVDENPISDQHILGCTKRKWKRNPKEYPMYYRVTHQKKILRGSKKNIGMGSKKNIKSIKTKILHIQNRREPGKGGENLCAMGDQKKIFLEIHVEGRRSRNTSLRSALIFSPGSFSCRGSIFCVYTVLLRALFLSVPLFV